MVKIECGPTTSFAWWRITAIMANASTTSDTWRMPSMLGSGFVTVEAEFFLGRLKAVLDHPAMAFNLHERVDPGPGRAPDRENASSPSAICRRISKSRVHTPGRPSP